MHIENNYLTVIFKTTSYFSLNLDEEFTEWLNGINSKSLVKVKENQANNSVVY